MSRTKRILLPLGAGLAGAALLAGLYFSIVSWAESPQHALQFFWRDRWIVIPILLGFGVQVALYVILKKRLFVPAEGAGPSGALTGAGGTTSALAMVACCAHHASDMLPILGLSAAAAFLAEYRIPFMLLGLGTTLVGIIVMILILLREHRKAIQFMKKQTTLIILVFFSLLLAACNGNSSAGNQPLSTQVEAAAEVTQLPVEKTPAMTPTQSAGEPAAHAYPELSDAQGAVTVFVTPANLYPLAERIDFDVALETHSVDLSMDLAALATLSTDTGRSVQAITWDAPLGGHHLRGTLSFPALVDGRPLLEGAQTLTLTIKDLDVPERVLTWELRP